METASERAIYIEGLVTRVCNGILCYATEEQIRIQMRSEGVPETDITIAVVKGARSARVRLGQEDGDGWPTQEQGISPYRTDDYYH